MTRYFFDIRDGENIYPDKLGFELESVSAAKMDAAQMLASLARDTDVAIEVRTEDGPLFQATFIDHVAKQFGQ